MNYFRTAMLLAGLTALFMGVGYLIGGTGGAMIALVIAAGTNLFSYWNSDRMVLSMYGAQEVDARTAPELYGMVRRACRRAPACRCRASISSTSRSPTPSPPAAIRRTPRSPRPPACCSARPRGARGRDGARARAHQEPRHADHDHHRDHRRRDLDAGAVRHVLRRPSRQQQRRLGIIGSLAMMILAPLARHAGADGDQPHPRICRRPLRRAHRRPAAVARLGARQDRRTPRTRSPTRRPSAIRRPRTCSSSTRCRARHGQPVLDPSGPRTVSPP